LPRRWTSFGFDDRLIHHADTAAMFVLGDILEKAGGLQGDLAAVSTNGVVLRYAELIERARRLAAAMQTHGIAPGDRVAILARNSFRYLEVNFACVFARAVLVPLNFRLAAAELHEILSRTDCRFIFCAAPFEVKERTAIGWDDGDGPGADNAYEALIAAGAAPRPAPGKTKAADVAQIFFTSGTTGQPKGVCLSHGNMVASALDSLETLKFKRADVWLHASPMFHLVDAFAIWGVTLAGGRHVAAHFEPDAFGALVQSECITKTSLPPTLLDWIARTEPRGRFDLSSLDLISYGGSPMQEAVYQRCRTALGCQLLQAYGLTEGSGFVCHEVTGDNPDPEHAFNTVGKPTRRVRVELRDAQGEAPADGEVGEIVVCGSRVFQSYWADPDATRAAFDGRWYRTGDLGVRTEDGGYTIVGRKKEMIISGGENVYPAEVVNALLSHPAVAEAAVFGLPSDRWGEEVNAVVYVVPERSSPHVAEDLVTHCRSLIGGYKSPKRIEISSAPLPKTGAGKIATAAIRAAKLRGGFQ
jgi:long-chain acyl-CoA synthetase